MVHPLDVTARTLAVAGSFAVVASLFLPWSEQGHVPLDVRVADWAGGAQPTLAVVLLAAVAVAAVGALVSRAAWPRVVAGTVVGALTLWWLASGPDASLTAGVWTALGGCVAVILSAGAAPTRRQAETSRRPANARPSVTSSA